MFDFFSKKRQEKALRDEDDREHFILRYKAFREILKNNNEVLITITEDENSFRAALMRFVREGIFQTIIKVAAGLIVGYLLLMFGLN